MSVSLGQTVPDFSASATDGLTVRLSELRGRRVVLYFYPKDNTPGCTVEGQQFRDLHDRFRAKHGFPFHLISDSDKSLCALFDVIKLKKLYGKESLGVERSTFLIDAAGVLRREWRKVKVDGHAEKVLAAVEALSPTA